MYTLSMSGVNARHMGFEVNAKYIPVRWMELEGMFSLGDWIWNSNPTGYFYSEHGQPLADLAGTVASGILAPDHAHAHATVMQKGRKIGGSAQTTGFLGVTFKPFKGFRIGADWVWSARNYSDYGTVSVSKYGAYKFDGSAWAVQDVTMIQPADFASMGLTYGNFSGTQAAEYLPKFLALTYPYAQEDDEMYIGYKYFANKETTNACALWAFDGTKWYDKVATNGVQEVTNQFVKRDGKWELDPSITITLPTGKGQAYSASFYQACVDWVKDNVPDGDKYITSYGNNDYYTGASAYQNNIDLRPGSARLQYAAAYEGMTDEEVVATMKKRFEDQVAPAVLHEWYPDMAPMGDFHPTVTIHFFIYDGATKAETIVFECESKGEFKFESCTWNDTEE